VITEHDGTKSIARKGSDRTSVVAKCVSAGKSAKVFIFNADTDIEKVRLSGCLSNSCDGAFAGMLYQAG
jgi:hypothetical protein